MKISASIYSDKARQLSEIIQDLDAHQVDLFHVDCNDNVLVFEDIKCIRTWSETPIDLHLITSKPEKYFDLLRKNPVDYLTVQAEELIDFDGFPEDISGKKGLAITTETPVEVFEKFRHFDFLLLMATVPGQSGGVFDAHNFAKIRQFRRLFPTKSIHVDGGVNGEVSFILRTMGVSTAVSGSYLFNAPTVGQALLNLTARSVGSSFTIKDFMTPISEVPFVEWRDASTLMIVEQVEKGDIGFCLVLNEGKLFGITASADIRKAFLRKINQLDTIEPLDLVNQNPLHIHQMFTVKELLLMVKKCPFPVMYLPVVGDQNEAVGIVTFANLIKAEL